MNLKLYQDAELQVLSALKSNEIVTRPGSGAGLWLIGLIPAAVLATCWRDGIFSPWVIFALGLLVHSTHMLYQLIKHSTTTPSKLIHFGSVAALVLTYLALMDIELRKAAIGSNMSGLVIQHGTNLLLKSLPSALTYGEVTILAHGFCLLVFSFITDTAEPDGDYNIATKILRVGVLGVLLLCFILLKQPRLQSPLFSYLLAMGLIGGCVFPYMAHLTQVNPFLWLLQFVFQWKRLGLLVLWAACSVAAGLAVKHQIVSGQPASTVVRKTFHVLATVVFLTGVLCDVLFLYVASAVVLAIFIALEIFRVLRLPPLAACLQDGFAVYADEKDIGGVALTPIYLLVGCSLPLWLHPSAVASSSSSEVLPLLSGVLAVGIGDACASYVGKNYGSRRWSGTNKTLMGTAGCILGQIAVLSVLSSLNYIPCNNALIIKAVSVITVTSFVEAKTDQVDNLVLPLIMYILLML